jgi:hypothetical protein
MSLGFVLVGLALLNWMSFVQGSNLFLLLVEIVLVVLLWRRSLQLVQRNIEFAELSTTFKVCFGLLLLLFLLLLIIPAASALFPSLAAQVPLFFLSGLISLSLARLEAIRQLRLEDGSRADPTRNWLLALTLLGSVLVVLVVVLETLVSFNIVESWLVLLNPIWNLLGIVVGWILYVLILVLLSPLFYAASFLLNLIFHGAKAAQKQPNQGYARNPPHLPQSPHAIPPEIVNISRLILFALVIVGILLLIRAALRRWFLPPKQEQEEMDEVRERLDARSLLREQWQGFWKKMRMHSHVTREPLEPGSARARYRELLDAVQAGASLHARKPNETPAEYEARLLPLLKEQAADAQASPEALAMQELTRVYADERYGAKRTDERTRASLGLQVPRVIQRLIGKKRA